MSDEDLIGYLFDSLAPAEREAVESRFATDHALAARLESLRLALAPLAADREAPAAPPGLVARTVRRLAEVAPENPPVPRPLPHAPRDHAEPAGLGVRFRADVLVACGIALFAGGLLFSGIGKLRAESQMLACQAQLRTLHGGLSGYADTHGGRYPQIGTQSTPTAETFARALTEAGQVPAGFRPCCPADPSLTTRPAVPGSFPATPVGYTYTLGYRTPEGGLLGLRRPDGTGEHDVIPICADYPTPAAAPGDGPLCPHSNGMNVLFAGGNVRPTTSALIGPNGDDIFRNVFGVVAAGRGLTDPVLGRPGDRP